MSPQDPGDGSIIAEFELPNPNSNPNDLTVGPDNNLWFTEYNGNRIGRITVDGQITEFDLPNPKSAPFGIILGPDGNLWFAETVGSRIGVITPDGQLLQEFPMPTRNSQPIHITAGPDGISGSPRSRATGLGGLRLLAISRSFACLMETARPGASPLGPTGTSGSPKPTVLERLPLMGNSPSSTSPTITPGLTSRLARTGISGSPSGAELSDR